MPPFRSASHIGVFASGIYEMGRKVRSCLEVNKTCREVFAQTKHSTDETSGKLEFAAYDFQSHLLDRSITIVVRDNQIAMSNDTSGQQTNLFPVFP